MKVWPLHNERGEIIAFEIPHRFLSSRSVARYFSGIPGVTVTFVRRMFQFGEDVHARFEYSGRRFVVWEPWGDNSRLWVGPDEQDPQRHDSIDALIAAVKGRW
jgi:hypothetical protein